MHIFKNHFKIANTKDIHNQHFAFLTKIDA
jgi:hypothetical protein